MQTPETPVRPKRILIIGAGPAGLVTLRNLVELGSFERVELVERRDDVGGVWYLDRPPAENDIHPRFPSPAYPGLVGNVLPEFLSYHGFPFPPPAEYDPENRRHQPFPTLTETHNYLKAFAKPFIEDGRLRLTKEVVRVEERPVSPGGDGNTKDKWRVILRDWADPANPGKELEELWDAVVVCVGWYDNPLWPDTQGLEQVKEKGLARHARAWRGPEGWEAKRTLVIGNANSSNDIAAQLAPYASSTSPVYRSIRRPNFPGFVSLPDERIEDVPPVKRYILYTADSTSSEPTYKVKVELEGGRIIDDIDAVWVGTGYKPYIPWLHVLPPPFPDLELDVARQANQTVPIMSLVRFNIPENFTETDSNKPTTSNWNARIPLLYRHIMYAPSPSLAFILTTMAYTPFTIADLGSLWLGLAWSEDEDAGTSASATVNGDIANGHADDSSQKVVKRVTYPETLEERLKFEKVRLELIENGRREVAASSLSSEETTNGTINTSTTNDTPSNNLHLGTTLATFSPTSTLISAWVRGTNGNTPSALNSYSVLGAYEEEYAKMMREEVIKARPELGAEQVLWSGSGPKDELYRTLGGGLPKWNPERTKKREGMYPVKLASLVWMRQRGKGGNREVQ